MGIFLHQVESKLTGTIDKFSGHPIHELTDDLFYLFLYPSCDGDYQKFKCLKAWIAEHEKLNGSKPPTASIEKELIARGIYYIRVDKGFHTDYASIPKWKPLLKILPPDDPEYKASAAFHDYLIRCGLRYKHLIGVDVTGEKMYKKYYTRYGIDLEFGSALIYQGVPCFKTAVMVGSVMTWTTAEYLGLT